MLAMKAGVHMAALVQHTNNRHVRQGHVAYQGKAAATGRYTSLQGTIPKYRCHKLTSYRGRSSVF